VLRDLGLSDKEIRVYLSLLGLGVSKVQGIAKHSKLLRTTVYEILESLIGKGLVSYSIKSGVRHFEAAEPSKLRYMVEEKRRKVLGIMPELEAIAKGVKEKPRVETYEGREGLKTFMRNVIREKMKEMHAFGAEGKFRDMFGYFFTSWDRERVKNGIVLRIIYNERVRDKKLREGIPHSSMRFLPSRYKFPSTTIVYGDNVGIVLWSAEPLAISIKSGEIAKSYENFFELLWDIAHE
jgi:sugar-specific transcriptional regulator TrmB